MQDCSCRAPQSLEKALSQQWIPEGSADQRVAALRTMQTDLNVAMDRAAVELDPIDEWNQFVGGADAASRPWQEMYGAALTLIQDGQAKPGECPLCHQSVDSQALAQTVSAELESLETASTALESARQKLRLFSGELREAGKQRADVRQRSLRETVNLPELPPSPIDDLGHAVDGVVEVSKEVVARYLDTLGSWDGQAIAALDNAIPATTTERDQALVEIGVLHSEGIAWRTALKTHSQAAAAFALAGRVFSEYQQRQHRHFQDVVQQISGRVAEIYGFLHPEGGIGAVAIEVVGEKGAELSVEFHGKKEMPPHRVLSESHLNSLGVALFLAMAETFNEHLGFLVLDDVINSFDREHRGRLAELLVEKFAGRQLIVLTHDEPFYTRLCSLAPSWARDHFTSWSYEAGPRTKRYDGDRLLQEAQRELNGGNRIQAAQLTRRALEELLQEACQKLEALLPFRRGQANDKRMADEVIKGLRRTLRDRARGLYGDLTELLDHIEADLQAALNVESHASMNGSSNQEVSDALQRVVDLRARFTCSNCETFVWHVGTPSRVGASAARLNFPRLPRDP